MPIDLNKMRNILLFLFCSLFASWAFGQDAEGVYTKVDENPAPTKTVKPSYPSSLKSEGVSGLVAVQIVIDEKGEVLDAKATKSSHPDFEKPALEAVKKWKFKPAKKDGKEVKVRVTIPFRFNLED